MLIASLKTLEPVDHTAAFPNTSFPPVGPTDEFLAEQGYAKVSVFKSHDRRAEKLVPAAPHYEAPWVYTVAVEPKTQDELAQEADAQGAQVRAQRNQILSACDWTQLADAPVDKTAWATYRQALRDIPSQPGFPWDVQWPNQPTN